MKSLFRSIAFIVTIVSIGTISSCSDDEQAYDPYHDWKARNTEWFATVADSARTAIGRAKAQFGDDWQAHCQWRMYKRLDHAQDYNTGRLDDSICVRIVSDGAGSYSPTWSDSIRFSYRGWMMPTTYRLYNQENQLVDSLRQEVFDQTYYGAFDPSTAAPSLQPVSAFVTGFTTALQYMVEGDSWMIYMPCRLAYGDTDHGSIPAYSTLLFHIHLAAVYPCNSGVPDWKVKQE